MKGWYSIITPAAPALSRKRVGKTPTSIMQKKTSRWRRNCLPSAPRDDKPSLGICCEHHCTRRALGVYPDGAVGCPGGHRSAGGVAAAGIGRGKNGGQTDRLRQQSAAIGERVDDVRRRQ